MPAEAKRAELIAEMATGRYASPTTATVETAMRNWLEDRRPKVKRVTFVTYERAARYICEPVLAENGLIANPGLGSIKLTDLQTAEIRRWHNALREHSGHYSASRAKSFLKAALDLAAEDFGISPPAMPKIDSVRGKAKKKILTPEQIAKLIAAAKADPERGAYVATPFLTGLRIGEMLGQRLCFASRDHRSRNRRDLLLTIQRRKRRFNRQRHNWPDFTLPRWPEIAPPLTMDSIAASRLCKDAIHGLV